MSVSSTESSLRSDSAERPSLVMTASTFPRRLDDDRPSFVLDLARGLSTRWNVTVLAPHEPGAAASERLAEVAVRRYRYRLAGLPALTTGGGILAILRAQPAGWIQVPLLLASQALALRRACRELQPALVHAHWIVPQGAVAVVAAGRGVPCLGTAHGGDIWALRRGRARRALAWTLRRLDLVTAVSGALRDAVREIAPETAVEVAPMGIDTALFRPEVGGDDENLWPQGAGLRLLFVGRLVEKKGLEILLRALADDRGGGDRLVVVGGGPLHVPLEQRARELGLTGRVRFLGAISHRALPSIYAAADLFVGPSITAEDGDSEGLGLVFAEALSAGTPVVASDLPAIRDVVRDGENGRCFPAGDAAALAATLAALRELPRRKALAVRARESILGHLSLAAVVERYDFLYRCLVSDARRAGRPAEGRGTEPV